MTMSIPRARAAARLGDHAHLVSLSPGGELFARRSAESVACRKQNGVPLALKVRCQLPDRGRLARTVDPRQHDHPGFLPGKLKWLLKWFQQLEEHRFQFSLQLKSILRTACAFPQAPKQVAGRFGPSIASEQSGFELFKYARFDRPAAEHA